MTAANWYLAGLLVAGAGGTLADGLDRLPLATQSEFRLLSEDLGAALSYKPLAPATPLGVPGFDFGVAVTATNLEHADIVDKVTSSDVPATLPVPGLRAGVGLPFNVDIGASYSKVPKIDVSLVGFEAKYAILEGGVAMPALAVRGSYTKLSGIDQLDLDTKGIDISLSKGFTVLTPYIGAGVVWVTSTPKNVPTLTEEKFRENRFFGGLALKFAFFNMVFEADKTGDATSYGAKVGLKF